MAWREQMRAARFRGVEFEVRVRTREGGRRGPTHEFPQEDRPDAQDTGRRARSMRVEAMVLGPDYMTRRDRLLEQLDAAGPGVYVDPWNAEWKVIVRSYSCTESTDRGGMAEFSIAFEEAGDERYPTTVFDTQSLVRAAADRAADAAKAAFDTVFKTAGLPQFVSAAAADIA
ncbi:MAG: DNA circularization N-terminal domain-containing protein, partial [Alphaproteobacteria bacterium]|nr:DNA circularization N-terminal domain-containing protein [Alphaproteobacteria bacterium]